MEFPPWYVPFITAPMLIPLLAVPHVIVAQFAVGAGILLADLVRRAHRDGNSEALLYLHGLTRFFILIMVVFGAVTGVGIWWTIGLTSPETTSALIHIFVFGWAAEWTMFALELVAAFAFYYLWDRLSPREHIIIGWIYAGAAWVSLVLITGITSFMLTTGNWTPEAKFFTAFSIRPSSRKRCCAPAARLSLPHWASFFMSRFAPIVRIGRMSSSARCRSGPWQGWCSARWAACGT